MSETMRSWQMPGPGPVSNMTLRDDIPKPTEATIGDEEVIIETISASINPADYKVPEMGFVSRAILPYPRTPGMDLSGRIVGVGSKITDLMIGDIIAGRVNPFLRTGTLSQYAIARRSNVTKLSPTTDVVTAAGIGTAALTAYQTIAPYVKADQGHEVFINGGSGGVGGFGIQIAKNLGCRVTVTCSTGKIELCKELGADVIIDYTKENVIAKLKERGQVFSVVADNVGNSPADLYPESQHFLKPGAPYVNIGGKTSFTSVIRLLMHYLTPQFLGGRQRPYVLYILKDFGEEELGQLVQWYSQDKLRVIVEKVFDFKDTLEAFDLLRKGSNTGKVLVKMESS